MSDPSSSDASTMKEVKDKLDVAKAKMRELEKEVNDLPKQYAKAKEELLVACMKYDALRDKYEALLEAKVLQ